jgi:rhodanese-related sulfurtransferase
MLAQQTGCTYLMHRAAPVQPVAERLEDNMNLSIGGLDVSVLYTPGHSQDSITLVLPDKLLTGDSLFLDDGGAGRDDLYGGDPGQHWDSLQRIGSLSDDLLIYPGHDYRGRQPSSLGQQKISNPYLRFEQKTQFITFTNELHFGIMPWMDAVVQANIAGATEPIDIVPSDTGNTCEVQNVCEPAGTAELPSGVRLISVEQLASQLATQNDDQPVLLDVREEEELSAELGQLPGIIHVPLGEVLARVDELTDHQHDRIVVICKKGARAKSAALLLANAGFTNLEILDGGMGAYREREIEQQQ